MAHISVCMATYNGDRFVVQQIESILSQLTPDDEIVISDDSSADRTVEFIKKINDPRIRLIENQVFKSPLLNFENALKHVTGEYVFLSDQDDIWESNKISCTLPLLKQFDLILTDCRVVNGEGEILSESFFKLRGSQPGFWQNIYKNSYTGCCMAFRREVLLYALPFPVQVHMHDWWIGLLAEVKGKVHFYDKPLIRYVRHGSNASPTGERGYGYKKRIQNRILLLWYIMKRLIK